MHKVFVGAVATTNCVDEKVTLCFAKNDMGVAVVRFCGTPSASLLEHPETKIDDLFKLPRKRTHRGTSYSAG